MLWTQGLLRQHIHRRTCEGQVVPVEVELVPVNGANMGGKQSSSPITTSASCAQHMPIHSMRTHGPHLAYPHSAQCLLAHPPQDLEDYQPQKRAQA